MPVETDTPRAVNNVFLADAELPMHARLFPLGFPLELATNSDQVISAAGKNWGMFPNSYRFAPISFSLTVTDNEEDRLPPPPKFRSHGHLMSIVSDAHHQVICDFSQGCATGWITRHASEQPNFLRLHFLEAPVMTILVAAHLAPMHVALVTLGGVGVALCGDSFAGKSTLAYACARSGWTFVSDDGTFLVRDCADRHAVGNPYSVRFREDAKLLFPELVQFKVERRHNGAFGIEARTADLAITTAHGCSIDHLVFLRRSRSGAATMNRFAKVNALPWLEKASLYGPECVRQSQRQAYRRLLDADIWELYYSQLSDAVGLLNEVVA